MGIVHEQHELADLEIAHLNAIGISGRRVDDVPARAERRQIVVALAEEMAECARIQSGDTKRVYTPMVKRRCPRCIPNLARSSVVLFALLDTARNFGKFSDGVDVARRPTEPSEFLRPFDR